MSTSKILITGGAGYIGSHTIIELLNRPDIEIISVDNHDNSSEETYNRIKNITGKTVKYYKADVCNEKELEKIFVENRGISGVIHFAALKAVGESMEKPLLYYRNNLNSLFNVLACMKKFNVPNLIFSSSCTVYGNISKLPVDENTPLQKPESPYGATKIIGEQMIEDFIRSEKNFKVVILRYFNPVGAHISGQIGEDPKNKPNNLAPIITQTAIGKLKELKVNGNDYPTADGTCVRDYVHVSDIADAHIKALDLLFHKKNKSNCEFFNLGNDKGITVLEAIKAFEKISGVKLNYTIGPRRAGDVIAIYSDSSKAKKELGWKTKYTLEDMMETAWKWEIYNSKKVRKLES